MNSVIGSNRVTICNKVLSSHGTARFVTSDNMAISEQLYGLRKKAGLTQQALADDIGINRSFIAQVERYGKDMTVTLLERWATACGARLILQREGEDLAGLESEEQAIVQTWRRLKTDPGRQAVLLEVAFVLERLEPQSLAMLTGSVEAAGKVLPFRKRVHR